MPERTALDPATRRLYSDILRAPQGHVFDAAVATTFSLDFETALTVPATLAFQAAEARAQLLDTPLALLEGLERLASRIAIFCEAGRIAAAPKSPNRLTALLEDTVTEVLAPKGGAFHPKLWLVRFAEPGSEVLRLAILSRNLTTDQSWDLSLVLDGKADAAPDDNAPLIAMLKALPDLAPRGATPKRNRALVASLAESLARVKWERPEGIRKISFHVNGLDGATWCPSPGRGMTVISPFLSRAALERLTEGQTPESTRLVSRAEELAQIPETVLARFGKVLILDEMAETEDGEEATPDLLGQPPRRGLHAKAFVTERHSSTEITMGSGNATDPALIRGDNVEVFATLSGYTRDLGGHEAQLEPKGLGKFLTEYQSIPSPDTTREDAAERRLDAVRGKLVRAGLTLTCRPQANERIGLELTGTNVRLPEGISLLVWPLMAGAALGSPLTAVGGTPQTLASLTLRDVTRWIGLRLTDAETGMELAFSLGTRLVDLPEGRDQAILRAMISDRSAFLRYLQLLLADPETAAQAFLAATGKTKGAASFGAFAEVPLLESLVRALSGDGRSLSDVERLVTRLGDAVDETGAPLIPPEFLTLWDSFRGLSRPRKGSRK